MKKRHLVKLRHMIQGSLEAHKMANWSSMTARSTIAGMIMVKFSKYIKEQEELEAKGKYDEAIAKQAQQYRDAEESKNKRIQELEAKQRQLEVEAPAVTALADVVHDPRYVLSQILTTVSFFHITALPSL